MDSPSNVHTTPTVATSAPQSELQGSRESRVVSGTQLADLQPTAYSPQPDESPLSRDALVEQCSAALVRAFADYNHEFRVITRRAPQRFEARDWHGSLRDAVERIELYDRFVNRAVLQMRAKLGEDAAERALWSSVKRRFTELIEALPDREFDKTFFNSVTRRTFRTVGTDAAVEFVALDLDPIGSITTAIETTRPSWRTFR